MQTENFTKQKLGSYNFNSIFGSNGRKIFGTEWNIWHKLNHDARTWHNSSTKDRDHPAYYNFYSCNACGYSFCNICDSEFIDNPRLLYAENSHHNGIHFKPKPKPVSKSMMFSKGRNYPVLHYAEVGMSKWTFDDPVVRKFVESRCEDLTLNLYAGKNRLEGVNEIRVDRLPDFKPDFWMEEELFLMRNKQKYQTGVWDPPWNDRKSKIYDPEIDRSIGMYTRHKDDIAAAIPVGGKIIGVGLHLSNFGWDRGFVIEEALICNSFGEYSIWAVSVERKVK